MTKAIVAHETGGPEVMKWEDVEVGAPGDGEVRIRHTKVGLNFIDVYFRTGLYPSPHMPITPGFEGAGVVEELGANVTGLEVGDRVCYGTSPPGAYAEARVIPAAILLKIPDNVADDTAAAMMLQGMTVRYLLKETYAVQAGDTILLHAAAGGVGLIACQWAKHLGITVIGTAGSEEKAALAKANGCDHVILYKTEDVAERVRDITNGAGVPVVYDSVGKDTLDASLASLRMRGVMVSFGNASGPIENFNLGRLSQMGSLYITRPTLFSYTSTREALEANANDLFDVVGSGVVNIEIGQTYALSDAAQAHTDLEGRKTTGSTVFTV